MFYKLLITGLNLLLILCFLSLANGNECPPPEVLVPCICVTPHDPVIRCGNLTKMETIQNIFKQSFDLRFKYFILENSTLHFLPASSLISKRFKGLMIVNTTLVGLFDETPSAANTIELFSLKKVKLQRNIDWVHFQKLTKLINLQFIEIHIKRLGKDFSENVTPDLAVLSLMHTRTTKLSDDVFAKMKSLWSILVAHTEIKTIKRSMFARPAKIRNFGFTYSKIEYLPDDLFDEMPALKSVGFTNNRISFLKEATFQGVFSQIAVLNVV
ncbi:uncharacterized protein CDAR_404591, partial [Caerostris darwini]